MTIPWDRLLEKPQNGDESAHTNGDGPPVDASDWDGANRAWRAMMLAKDLETWVALLRGESVPLSRLDANWLARFGRKS